jgi:hypothetical protein
MRCLGASGQLGYGMPREAFWAGIAAGPEAIGADMGSVDPGPFYLGAGVPATGEPTRRDDLAMLIQGARQISAQAVIGSAGTAGARPHVETTVSDIHAVLREADETCRAAIVMSDVDPSFLHRKLDAGEVRSCNGSPELDHATVERSTRLVAQMGIEPVIEALRTGAEVVVAGRCCDTAVFAAAPVLAGYDRALATHQAKLIECASQCADPGGRDAIMGTLEDASFVVESMNPLRRCTPVSVAAHSLYEQMDPYRVAEPGGELDLSTCEYSPEGERATRVRGARFHHSPEYWVKVEGVALAGFRSFALGGIRDPIAITQLDAILAGVRAYVDGALPKGVEADQFNLRFLRYGHDAVLGEIETARAIPHEVLVLTDVVASNQEIAHSICATAKQALLHYFYDGILATGGNLAIPFGPDVHDAGSVYEFSVYHLVRIDDPLELFPMNERILGGTHTAETCGAPR